jgi:hypothetical protein
VFCAAFPAGDGIPMEILFGADPHDHLRGDEDEANRVYFETKEGRR